jgi:hypothetical protein
MYNLYAMNRASFFSIFAIMPDIKIAQHGQVFCEVWLTDDKAALILSVFPESIWRA